MSSYAAGRSWSRAGVPEGFQHRAGGTRESWRHVRPSSVSVSGDTLVVGAPWEGSSATGVNGDQARTTARIVPARRTCSCAAVGDVDPSRRTSKASNPPDAGDGFGDRGVGVGRHGGDRCAAQEDSSATGVADGARVPDNSAPNSSGAVYVFVRNGDDLEPAGVPQGLATPMAVDRFGALGVVVGRHGGDRRAG